MKRLFLCRHAKSSWKDTHCPDIDRRLNKRGNRDAPFIGNLLFSAGVKPDCILSSPAARARKTAFLFAEKLGFSNEKIILVDALYAASVDTILASLCEMDDGLNQVLLVGHNPEITLCANLLARLSIANVPTCGVVALELSLTSWKNIGEGKGKLISYYFPKDQKR
jgi:phosphohistidine phosphatase